jgi:hypothetical protein
MTYEALINDLRNAPKPRTPEEKRRLLEIIEEVFRDSHALPAELASLHAIKNAILQEGPEEPTAPGIGTF